MGDYELISPDGRIRVQSTYQGEPPHGDSYQALVIRGRKFPGYAWGCPFAFSPCSRYLAFSWMEEKYQRKTVVVDLELFKFTVLPRYVYDFTLIWPILTVVDHESEGTTVNLDRSRKWQQF